MKYLRRYNEALTTDQQLALQDLCDAHFAYLYDEGFELAITERRRTADRHIQSILANTYLANSQNTFTTYIITLSNRKSFQVEDVKDYFEPFLDSLKRNNVNIYGISVKGISHYSYGSNHADNLDFITNDQLAKVSGMTMTINTPSRGKEVRQLLTSVSVEVLEYDLARAQVINEAFSYSGEKWEEMELDLEEYCNSNLAFLLDEGFEIYINSQKTIDKFYVTLYKPKDYTNEDFGRQRFELDDIKDHIIPFMNRLIKDYNVDSIFLVGFVINRPPDQKMMMDYKPYTHKIKSPDDLENLSGTLHYFNFEIYLPNIS